MARQSITAKTKAPLAQHELLPYPALVDTQLEDRGYRTRFDGNLGGFAVTFAAGEDLGEILVSVQFEGAPDNPEHGMEEQNELLASVSKWLHDLLGRFGTPYTVTLEGKPCPKAATPLDLGRAQEILEGAGRLQGRVAERGAEHRLDRTRRRDATE